MDATATMTVGPVKLAKRVLLVQRLVKMFAAQSFVHQMLPALLMTTEATASVGMVTKATLTIGKDVLKL